MVTTLANILTLTRQRSNMENNNFISEPELISYVNNSLAELYGIMCMEYDEYNITTFQAVLPNDGVSNVISIPSNFFKLRGVDYQNLGQGQPQWYTLRSFQFPERNRNNNTISNITSPWGKMQLSYRLADVGLIIQPQQQAGGVFQVWYTPKFVNLVNFSDSLTIQMDSNAWVEYAVVDCCIKIYDKQNLDPSGFMQEKALLRARVLAEAKNRDSSGPKRVANTRYENDDICLPYFADIW